MSSPRATFSDHRLGITGTRHPITPAQRRALTDVIGETDWAEFHHGDCTGADEAGCALFVAAHPLAVVHAWPGDTDPQWRADTAARFVAHANMVLHERMLPLVRNRMIVERVDLLVAVPETAEEQRRSGTWSTIRYARGRRPLAIIEPDGVVRRED